MKALGSYNSNQNDAESSKSEFMDSFGAKDDLQYSNSEEMFDGDETFKAECDRVKNEKQVVVDSYLFA